MKQAQVTIPGTGKFKAMIAPHDNLSKSGPTAAWAYKNFEAKVKEFDRVVILGPSHKLYFDYIGVTECTEWETPFGNVTID